MFGPLLISAAFGFIKGLTSRGEPQAFSLEQDFLGPVKEEFLYRGPLWLKPNLPFGSTAVIFAADHLVSDHKSAGANARPPTAMQVLARFGDTFAGGLAYEAAMRGPGGIFAAIGAHCVHNIACGIGSKVRR